jgi:hypothetical protein
MDIEIYKITINVVIQNQKIRIFSFSFVMLRVWNAGMALCGQIILYEAEKIITKVVCLPKRVLAMDDLPTPCCPSITNLGRGRFPKIKIKNELYRQGHENSAPV